MSITPSLSIQNTNGGMKINGPLNNTTLSGISTFTGSVNGITKNMIALGNVDNISDNNKPISYATKIALDTKAAINNPTFTGIVSGPNAQFDSIKINTYFHSFVQIIDSNYLLTNEHPNVTIYGNNSENVMLPTTPIDGMSINLSNMSDNDLMIYSGNIVMYNLLIAPYGLTEISLQKHFMYNFIYTEKSTNNGQWYIRI